MNPSRPLSSMIGTSEVSLAPEFATAQKNLAECNVTIWDGMMQIVGLEDELTVQKAALEVEAARIRLDPEVSLGKNEKERDAQFTILASQDEKYRAALESVRSLTVTLGEQKAKVVFQEAQAREWRLVMGFLTAPRES